MTRDYKKQANWRRHNTLYIGVTLNNNTDADIIEYININRKKGESMQGCIKKCIRYALQAEEKERNRKEEEKIEELAAGAQEMDVEILLGK